MLKKLFTITSFFVISVPGLSSGRVTYFGQMKPGGFIVASSSGVKRALFEGEEVGTDSRYVTVGFDRDDRGELTLDLFFTDGTRETKKIYLPDREYHVQHVRGLQDDHVTPRPVQMDRIRREREALRNAIEEASRIEKAYFSSGLMRPVGGGRITGVFGSKRVLNGTPRNPHNGIDIALPEGTPVYAMADGVVLLADDFFFSGKYVMVAHGQGLVSFYMHLSKIDAVSGQEVSKGEKIGEVGMTGRATGPHLHWGVQWKNRRVDPAFLLNTGIGEEGIHYIKVKIQEQKLYLYEEGSLKKTYPVSTSRYGTGNESGSYKTPLGLHRIARKIGHGEPVGTVFRGRMKTGEITEIYYDERRTEGDYILTRILRLQGLEPGVNRGEGIGSFERYIYIHGTKEEGLVGESVSRGCVRMKNADVIELFDMVEKGTFVEIVP